MGTTPTPSNEPPVAWRPPADNRGRRGFDVSDFLTFRYFVTPAFITAIYIIGAVLITLGALAAVASPASGGLASGLVVLVAGNLWWRIVLEFVMVLFRVNDSLASIDRRGGGGI